MGNRCPARKQVFCRRIGTSCHGGSRLGTGRSERPPKRADRLLAAEARAKNRLRAMLGHFRGQKDGPCPVIEDSRAPARFVAAASVPAIQCNPNLASGSEPLPFPISQGIFQINSDCFRLAPWTFPGTGNKMTPS